MSAGTETTLMALETAEAPQAVARMLDANRAALAEFGRLFRERRPSHFVTCARGSSDHAASYFKYLAEIMLGVPCCSVGASVVSIYGARLHLRDTLLVTISQSGRSPDILAFQAEARRAGVPTVAITNDAASPLAADADVCLPLMAGPELSVAATKTFITSAAMAAALVGACGSDAGFSEALARLPEDLAAAQALRWTAVEDRVPQARSLYVLGRGPSLPMAQEAALKLKETSGLHAEAFSAAEVMHGPMELVEEGFPVLVFAARDAAAATTAESVERLSRAGAHILQPDFRPAGHPALDPLSMIQTFYGSAERIARRRGRNPDKPRLLQKVTETR
ncbi:SIS domain-containing protein [Labrys monachus]|uniref:Glucosamine--fructose-6-phosphate aminotransferase (Isomerizing) n=1 Tax=Labrys monachus TaxID=217067 RepID=A0ABU0F7J9_9HYPH|nr:SIS domain-containing protein [Labrys monachus]MDQ0390594.1 glucosamine--fructose-6-phosphate aminotransferase (isomerizing) [Labrys monachus]